MENRKINIAEILRVCPKGMELECTMFDNVTFELVDNNVNHPIKIRVGKTQFQRLTAFGEWYKTDIYQDYYTKCVIFPKGKNTWEGFVPPYKFKNGELERGLALQRLKEKLADTNKGWKPDWSSKEDKFVIVIRDYTLRVATTKHIHFVLAFKDENTATGFMWENDKLIREAYRFFYG